MLRTSVKYLFVFIFVAAWVAVASAESASSQNDTAVGTGIDYSAAYRGITKVKPSSPAPAKVKPYSGLVSGFEGLSRYNPVTWGPDCMLPAPAKGQFLVGPKLFFARIRGDGRKDIHVTTGPSPALVDFEDHLGFKQSGNLLWSIEALYQFRSSLGFRYSFSPMTLKNTSTATSGFNFGGQGFAAGSQVRSKWDRFQHRAGLVLTLSSTNNSLTNFYADWLHIEDKLVVGGGGTGATGVIPVVWSDNKNLAVLGLEFSKCLRNYRGNTLALECKGGLAFLDDCLGYEAEAGLAYLIPIKTGRFGFVKGGYQYMNLKKEKNLETMHTSMDGAFLKIGFLF
jgi:hypothetical protein